MKILLFVEQLRKFRLIKVVGKIGSRCNECYRYENPKIYEKLILNDTFRTHLPGVKVYQLRDILIMSRISNENLKLQQKSCSILIG